MAREKQKRAAGDGTVYPTKDGRFRVEVVVGWTATGRPRRKVGYAPNKALAESLRRELAAKARAGLVTGGRAPTLEAWLEEWITMAPPAKMRERTKRGYRSYIRTWIHGRPIAKKRLDKIRAADLAAVYSEMRVAGRSESTVSQMHRILSRGLTVAVQYEELATNPAQRLEAPQPAPFTPNLLSVDDARRLIAAAEKLEDGARWLLNLALGLRQAERLALAWDRVDLRTGKITIDRTIEPRPWKHGCSPEGKEPVCGKRAHFCPQKHSGGRFVGKPKSTAGEREPILPEQIVAALERLKEYQERVRLEEGDRWTGFTSANGVTLDLVFTNRFGRPINAQDDWEDWKKFLAANGVPEVRVHDARHTAATTLLVMGVDPRVVMDIMGWSTSSMLKRYQHVVDELKAEAAKRIGAALWAPPADPAPDPANAEVLSMDAFRRRRAR
ncbi:tyrosine-type recombinase/integrase [Sinomonas soli]